METYTVAGGDGTNLAVETTGPPASTPIIFIHGYSQSRLCWKRQFTSNLIDDFRLVRFDNRGHGDSDKPPNAYRDPGLWAADIQAVIDSLDQDHAILVGWSYGGLIMTDYLSVHGTDHVLGLNYVGAITEKGTDDAATFAGEKFVGLADGLESTDAEQSVEALSAFVELCTEEPLSPADHYFMLGYNARTPPRVRQALQARTADHEDTLHEIDVPVLLSHGDADPVVGIGAARKHAELLPDAELSIYEDGGHSPFWNRPERFNDELRAFADRVST